MMQPQNLPTESLHANKGHNINDTNMASDGPMEKNEVLVDTLVSNVNGARAFSNVCEYLCSNIFQFTKTVSKVVRIFCF